MLSWHPRSVVSGPGDLLTPLPKHEPYSHHFDDNNTFPGDSNGYDPYYLMAEHVT